MPKSHYSMESSTSDSSQPPTAYNLDDLSKYIEWHSLEVFKLGNWYQLFNAGSNIHDLRVTMPFVFPPVEIIRPDLPTWVPY